MKIPFWSVNITNHGCIAHYFIKINDYKTVYGTPFSEYVAACQFGLGEDYAKENKMETFPLRHRKCSICERYEAKHEKT